MRLKCDFWCTLLSISIVLACSSAMAEPLTLSLTNPKGDVSIWMESSLKRIFPKSAPGESSTRTLNAARNQKVSFQIAINNKAPFPATAQLSTVAPENIGVQIRRVGYVPMHHMTVGTRPEELDGVEFLPGFVPDPLFPEQQVTAGPLESQSFWITLDVSTTATPGKYTIPFTMLFVHDQTSTTLTAEVNVRDFTINKRKDFPVTHWW